MLARSEESHWNDLQNLWPGLLLSMLRPMTSVGLDSDSGCRCSCLMSQTDARNPRFVTTRWSMVLQARGGRHSQTAGRALAELCEVYWFPIYAFVRRQSASADEAEDLTQAFFAHLLSRSFLKGVRAERGTFRSWLLASLRNFLSNESDRDNALKRGGQVRIVSLDRELGEQRFLQVASRDEPADALFERQWSVTLLSTVLSTMKTEMTEAGQAELFDVLSGCLTTEREQFRYAEAAEELGVSVEAARTTAHRMRKRYRRLLRAEIRETVSTDEDVGDEIRRLFQAVARTV